MTATTTTKDTQFNLSDLKLNKLLAHLDIKLDVK